MLNEKQEQTAQLAYQLVMLCDPETIPLETTLNALAIAFCSFAKANPALMAMAASHLISVGNLLAAEATSTTGAIHIH
ncbi:hypothetical protein [Comamonas fluminis]|uniref:hypothetical protein n=1 Tax=Comamonas fluminis TaxID=2796366 RepID=UPI001C43E515|nr:hypothetical protein [Comamonas fluminis]